MPEANKVVLNKGNFEWVVYHRTSTGSDVVIFEATGNRIVYYPDGRSIVVFDDLDPQQVRFIVGDVLTVKRRRTS